MFVGVAINGVQAGYLRFEGVDERYDLGNVVS